MGFDPDLDLEADEAGETLGEPCRGPFMDQSSWERFKEEVSECESRAGETRMVPSWTLAESDR